MSRIHSNVGSWGESCVVSANEVQLYTGAQLSFGDLTPYLTYNIGQCLGSRSGSGTGSGSACFLGLLDPDTLVRGTDLAPDLSLFLINVLSRLK